MNKFTFIFIFLAALCIYKLSFAANSCRVLVHNSQISAYAAEVTLIIGTDRLQSNSKIIANELLSELSLQSGVRVNVIDLSELPASLFKSDYFEKKSPQFTKKFIDPIERSAGLIFLIPEYDGAVPGILSYYLNHMRTALDKKQVALVGLSSGKWGARSALDAFKGTLTHRGARVLGDLQINIESVNEKIQQDKLADEANKKRLTSSVQELTEVLNQSADSISSQKTLAQLASALKEKTIDLKLNNANSVSGKLSHVVLNENQTLAYVQFTGPTSLKNKEVIIPGQDTDTHSGGYGMPVGKIEGFKKEWYKKNNLKQTGLAIGKRVKMLYESGVVVNGKIKNLTYDSEGNLIVITFTDVTVKNSTQTLFPKAWGDFDIAVGDHVEQITPH